MLLPFHLPVVMKREQYLQIAAFKSDVEKFRSVGSSRGRGPANQFLVAVPSNGSPFELKNSEFLKNDDSAVVVRHGASMTFETAIEQVTGFRSGMGVQVGIACLVKRSDEKIFKIPSYKHSFL